LTYDPPNALSPSLRYGRARRRKGVRSWTIDGPRLDSRVSPGMSEAFFESECVPARLRAGVPNGDACRKVGDRHRPARTFRRHNLCLLRRWLHFQAEMHGE